VKALLRCIDTTPAAHSANNWAAIVCNWSSLAEIYTSGTSATACSKATCSQANALSIKTVPTMQMGIAAYFASMPTLVPLRCAFALGGLSAQAAAPKHISAKLPKSLKSH